MTAQRSTPDRDGAPKSRNSSAAWTILRLAASNERVVSQCANAEQVAPYVKLERLGLLRDVTPPGEKVRDEWQITQNGLDTLDLLGTPLSEQGAIARVVSAARKVRAANNWISVERAGALAGPGNELADALDALPSDKQRSER